MNMDMKKVLVMLLWASAVTAAAQEVDSVQVFLDDFGSFVASVEKNDSVVDWEECNAAYKNFRTVYKNAYKDKMGNDEYAQYNKIKARYIKQVSLKKVGRGIKSKMSTISSAVKGAVEGALE